MASSADLAEARTLLSTLRTQNAYLRELLREVQEESAALTAEVTEVAAQAGANSHTLQLLASSVWCIRDEELFTGFFRPASSRAAAEEELLADGGPPFVLRVPTGGTRSDGVSLVASFRLPSATVEHVGLVLHKNPARVSWLADPATTFSSVDDALLHRGITWRGRGGM
jgi:hypothetical protein